MLKKNLTKLIIYCYEIQELIGSGKVTSNKNAVSAKLAPAKREFYGIDLLLSFGYSGFTSGLGSPGP